jgi:hypothetical protein
MSRRKRAKLSKPTGSLGHIEIDPEGKASQFVPLTFPRTKEEVEQFVLDKVLTLSNGAATKFYHLTGSPVRNVENHFDFSLPTDSGIQFLDLMEVKPTRGTHESAPGSYWVWGFAEAVYGELLKKSAKYGVGRSDRIHLLLYNTDWRQVPDRGVLQLLMLWLAHGSHCFRTVLNCSIYGGGDAELFRLFPSKPEERRKIDVAGLKKAALMGPDYSRVHLEPDGAVEVPLSPPPPGWRPDL